MRGSRTNWCRELVHWDMLRRIFATSPALLSRTRRNHTPEEVTPVLASTIRRIIAEDRVVLFITGTPQEPRCGFTVKMIDMMHQLGVKYSFYNILEDDEVCEGLKKYSDWPTYPQLYVDGDLIGGYDVCKGMLLSGQLTKLLSEKDLL